MVEDSQQEHGLSLLDEILGPVELQDVWYNRKVVRLDGFVFRHCRFDACQLHVSSSNFEMHRCLIGENNRFYYGGGVTKILQLFNNPYEWVEQTLPRFSPERHEDGTISILWPRQDD